MTRLIVLSAMALWVGATMVLSSVRAVARRPLAQRLAPFVAGAAADGRRDLALLDSFRAILGPTARAAGDRLAALAGVSESLAVRLERVHSPLDVTTFRLRQLGWVVAALGVGGALAIVVSAPPALAMLFVAGAPVLAFLLLEQQLAAASSGWQRRLFLELAVVSEQLGMLLSAGYSLSGALDRLASRGQGACATDLRRVGSRMRQGLSDADALREWALLADVDAVGRLTSILALNREATDLGRLIADEARTIRREVHRQLLEGIERRTQQVWIPVTVATLIPGVIFMAVPFMEAMSIFSGS